MSRIRKIPHADWWLGGLMFLLCAALTVLQYRWTGEIARAEMTRRRGNLNEQAQALAQEFDAELSASCDQLTPDRADFANQSREAAHLARFKEWQAAKPRPIFSRIALGESAGNQVQLSLLDQTAARFVRTNWPAEWAVMQEGLIEKSQGGPPPSSDTRGVLLEFPVFGGSGRGGPGGEHWLILELDLAYARDRWLPELIARHLNPAGSVVNEARISLEGRSPGVLHATTGAAEKPREGIISVRFNRLGKTARRSDMPGQTSGAWLLEAWQRPGALEAVVAAARRRNFGVAVCINLLMLATGVALMHHTRRSRRLAEQQMNFVANVSHEFRTPLTVIRGAAHNLKRGVVQEPEQVGQYSCLIAQHAERLGELVEQVLEFAGAKKNQASAPRQPVALAEVLKEAIAATEHEAQAARCRVELKVLPSLPTVSGDAPALRRVFQNLITNAAKHGGDGGWIGITAASANGSGPAMVEVQVADYGPGIPESEQAEIFKPFFRGARAQEKQTRGSGLGLSLVREIVEAHGGAISVRSTDNCGTTFTIRLPAAAETKPE